MALFTLLFSSLFQKWALDFDKSACESLKLNHPETQVSIAFVLFDYGQVGGTQMF